MVHNELQNKTQYLMAQENIIQIKNPQHQPYPDPYLD